MFGQLEQPTLGQAQSTRALQSDALPDRIRLGWVLIRIIVIVCLIVLFNFYFDRIGIVISATDPETFVPLLDASFKQYLPWLNLWLGLAWALNIAHIWLERWRPVTRWADLGLNVLGILILGQLILGSPILIHNPIEIFQSSGGGGTTVHLGENMALYLEIGLKIVLILSVGTLVAGLGRKLGRLLVGNESPC